MKILDRYLLKTFVTTFTTVFVILFFIFILQTVWLFIAELAGKDLNLLMVLKFLMFSMPRIVPLVLPLSVLLASIMTFGDLAENYEFAAMKSSGVSFQRTIKFLTVFIVSLSVLAFVFANNVIPFAEYKFINFRKDIAQRTPAMAIAEGQFSTVGNYSIKVAKKSGKEGNILTDVTIHKKAYDGSGNKTVIKAKKGELMSAQNSNNLQLVLHDGYYYEDVIPKKYEERQKLPFAKSSFKKYIMNMDLSKLNNSEFEQGEITNSNTMLNSRELKYTIDSLNIKLKKDKISFGENSYARTGIATPAYYYINKNDSLIKNKIDLSIIANYDLNQKNQIIENASSTIENILTSINSTVIEQEEKQKVINLHWIALHDKFVIAFACLLMFFIGAPLGSIIKKGGLGLPIVFAVLIFIVFHFINSFGKRVAQQDGISPFLGSWMATFVLLPLSFYLTRRAIQDNGGAFSADFFSSIQDFFISKFSKKEEKTLIEVKEISLENLISNYKKSSQLAMVLYVLVIVFLVLVVVFNSLVVYLGYLLLLLISLLLHYIYESQTTIGKIAIKNDKNNIPKNILWTLIFFLFYPILYLKNKKIFKNKHSK